jgi:predicted HTH transcriptional regulator
VFDSADELLVKIRLGEDNVLELKRVVMRGSRIEGPRRDELADELAAFANTNDGVCVLGVDDRTREVVGIEVADLDAVEQMVREVCADSIRPPLSVRIIRMDLPNALGEMRPVLKMDVPRSLFVHQSPGGYFQRIGSSKRELLPDQLARLFQQRGQARVIRFEEQAVPDTAPDDLEPPLYLRFLGEAPDDPLTLLRKMRLVVADDAGTERASVAGVLMATSNPERWLSGAYIEAVRYRGNVQDSNYQADAARITGPLDKQILDALAFARRNMTVAATKEPGRIEVPQYSERALFEAIVNAVAHRDYSVYGSKIRLFMFDDRLELYSPGPLPNSLTVESLPLRQSTRNELITSLLARCPTGPARDVARRQAFMERRGDGVPIILKESERLSSRAPVYRVLDDAEVMLTIWSAPLPNQVPEGAAP